ncbi:MAG: NTP/NDP exchange transporter [Candidatus Aminicenantia bacterium]
MKAYNNEGMKRTYEKSPGFAHRILRIFTVVYPGEAPTAFLLTFNIFLLLTAYYILKPIREALILAGKGAELRSYLSGAIAILFIPVIKIFSDIASKVPRQILITWVTLFFISNLVLFYVLNLIGIPLGTMGIIFFVWIGIFNLMVIAQFWGFANDLYTHEAGKRLFPIVMFGANFGALWGPNIHNWLVGSLGLYQLMLVAGGILGICILLTLIIHKREIKRTEDKAAKVSPENESRKKVQEKPLKKGGGFRFVFKSRYLLYIAFLILLLNFVNTNGEYILGKVIIHNADKAILIGETGGLDKPELIGKLYADFYFIVNLIAAVIQLFLMSRIFKWFGVRGALFILPLVALGGYFFIAFGATLIIVRWVKTFENSTDYSIMNATRHALFLITSREAKYKAKAAIDTFFWRAGDVLSALLVFLGTTYLAFNIENIARVAQFNVAIVVIWIILCIFIMREHKELSAKRKISNENFK